MSKSHFQNWSIDSNDQPRKGETQSKPAKQKTVKTTMAAGFEGINLEDRPVCPKCNGLGTIEEQDGVACNCPAGEGPREDQNGATQENAQMSNSNETRERWEILSDKLDAKKAELDAIKMDAPIENVKEVNEEVHTLKEALKEELNKEEETRAATPASDAQKPNSVQMKENSMDKTIVKPIPSVEGEATPAEIVMPQKEETKDLLGALVGMSKEAVQRFLTRVFEARTAQCQWFYGREANNEDLKNFKNHSQKVWKPFGSKVFMVCEAGQATHLVNQKYAQTPKGYVPYTDRAVLLKDSGGIQVATEDQLAMTPIEYVDSAVFDRPLIRWTVLQKGRMSQKQAVMAALTSKSVASEVNDLVHYDDGGDTVYLNVTWAECEEKFTIHAAKEKALKVIKRIKRIFDADKRVGFEVTLKMSGYNMDGRLAYCSLALAQQASVMGVASGVLNEAITFKPGDVINSTLITGKGTGTLNNRLGKGDIEIADPKVWEEAGLEDNVLLLNGSANITSEVKFKDVLDTHKVFFKLGESDKLASVSQLSFLLMGGSWACFQAAFEEEFTKLKEVVAEPGKVWSKFQNVKSGWMKQMYDAHVKDPDNKVLELLACTWWAKNQTDALKSQMRDLRAKGPGTMKVSPTLLTKWTYVGNNDRIKVAEYISTVGNIFVCGKLMVCSAATLRAVGDVHGGMDLDDKVELLAVFDLTLNKFICYGFRWPVGYREWFMYNVWVGDGRRVDIYDIDPMGECPVGHGKGESIKDDKLCAPVKLSKPGSDLFDLKLISKAKSDQIIIGQAINAQAVLVSLGEFDHPLMKIRQSDLVDLAAQGECKGGFSIAKVRSLINHAYAHVKGDVDGILALGRRTDKKHRVSNKWQKVTVNAKTGLSEEYAKLEDRWSKAREAVLGHGGLIHKKAEEIRLAIGLERNVELSSRTRDIKATWGRLWSERFAREATIKSMEEGGLMSEKEAAGHTFNLSVNATSAIMTEVRLALAAGEVLGEDFQQETALGLLINFLSQYGQMREATDTEDERMMKGMDTVLFTDEVMTHLVPALTRMLEGEEINPAISTFHASSREFDLGELGNVFQLMSVMNQKNIPFIKHVNVREDKDGNQTLFINVYTKEVK